MEVKLIFVERQTLHLIIVSSIILVINKLSTLRTLFYSKSVPLEWWKSSTSTQIRIAVFIYFLFC